MTVRRIHITGGPGSGKTTAAKRLGALLDLPVYDWDGIAVRLDKDLPRPLDAERMQGLFRAEVASVVQQDGWISEGAYLGWTMPLLEAADLIVRMDVPWRVASYRILSRHVRAELARNNRFPGWMALYRFWRWSAAYYANTNRNEPDELNIWGTPNTLEVMLKVLQPFEAKVVLCHTLDDVAGLAGRLETAPSWR